MSEPLDLSLIRKQIRAKQPVSHGQSEALLAEYERVVTFLAAKPEPSVPLSAIRALVQQWREEAREVRLRQYNATIWKAVAFEVERRAKQLAALCPAPPEDHV